MQAADELLRLYETTLGKGPFPTPECERARILGKLHGELVIWLADVAGLASRGRGLLELSAEQKATFERLASTSLFDRFPELRKKINADETPELAKLMTASEHARQLILQLLHG